MLFWAIILLCIGMVCALRAVNRLGAAEAAAGITDWGLSFQSEGAPPVANASQEYLRNFDALYVGEANQKEIYITFDAGFENGNINAVMDGDIDGFINAYLKMESLKNQD